VNASESHLVPDHNLESAYADAMAFLFGRLNYEKNPGRARSSEAFRLDGMAQLLEALGNPQDSVPTIHIAGSKGKGSTSTMVAHILEAAGYRVGLFTSPHAQCYEERMTINQLQPDRREIVDLVETIQSCADSLGDIGSQLTFFELTTAVGWLHFQNQKVDVAVIEVGLGGRLDSTNVCSPLVSAIVSISLDHTRLLGDNVESIAREKAGILKSGVPAVSGVLASGPQNVITEIAQQRQSPLYQLGTDFTVKPVQLELEKSESEANRRPMLRSFDFHSESVTYSHLKLGMPGEHQTHNGAVAVQICSLLNEANFSISESAIRNGLQHAVCPMRIEVVSEAPLTIIDAAHNPASMQALCETLSSVQADHRIAIVAISRDKDVAELLRLMSPHFDEFVITKYAENPRSTPLEQLSTIAEQEFTVPWTAIGSLADAFEYARAKSSPRDLLCVTGSFFIATEARKFLNPK